MLEALAVSQEERDALAETRHDLGAQVASLTRKVDGLTAEASESAAAVKSLTAQTKTLTNINQELEAQLVAELAVGDGVLEELTIAQAERDALTQTRDELGTQLFQAIGENNTLLARIKALTGTATTVEVTPTTPVTPTSTVTTAVENNVPSGGGELHRATRRFVVVHRDSVLR